MRLLRKGAISGARKAMESKGLGDLRDLDMFRQMREKHLVRVKQIEPDMHTSVPEE